MIGLALWAALAVAGPPEDPPITVVVGDDGEVVHEVIVYGDLRVQQAIDEVLLQLEGEGYTDIVDKGDYLRVRHPNPWKGEVRIYDDGWIYLKRQPMQFKPPTKGSRKPGPVALASCVVFPIACIRPGGQLVGARKFRAQERRTLDEIGPEVAELGDRVADRETEDKVNDLPDHLEALWVDGVPLDDGPTLDTVAARKAALLHYWESRTDTVWGDRVRLAVEAFIRAEVQTGDHPFTPDEIAEFNAERYCVRELDLDRPWDEVVAEVEPAW